MLPDSCEDYDDGDHLAQALTADADSRLLRAARRVASSLSWVPVRRGVRLLPMEIRRATALLLHAAEEAIDSGGRRPFS